MSKAHKNLLAFGAIAAFLVAAPAASANLIPAHSHWDVHRYTDHEVKFCYDILARNSGAGSTIAFLPLREVDSQNFMQLTISTSGLVLKRRVSGTFTTDTPIYHTSHTYGVGSKVMIDFTMVGSTYTAYQLNSDLSRGAMLYQWSDGTYPYGVNISYYTQPYTEGEWDFVHAFPINGGSGAPHDISGLLQDARSHNSVTGAATFDSPFPANGDASGLTGSTSIFGIPHGSLYTFSFSVSGSGHADFRDPGDSSDEKFFQNGWYRLNVPASGNASIAQYSGSGTLVTTHTASAGGSGSYAVKMNGHTFTLLKGGVQVLAFTDPGPTSGLRLRVVPGTSSTWSWTGVQG